MSYRKWKAGNDILEYLCRGYKLKSCATCKRYEICPERDKGTFCNRYRRKGIRVASLYRGRIRKVGLSSSLDAIEAEQVYIDKKLKAAKDSLSDNEDDNM